MELEQKQVVLRLTDDPEIIKTLRARKRFQKDVRGEKLVLQFDGKDIEFRPGVSVTVGERVAAGLIRDSIMVIGDPLVGEIKSPLVRVREHNIGETGLEKKSPTVCPVCKPEKDYRTFTQLARHLERVHKHDRPHEPQRSARSNEPPEIDWEVEVNEEAGVTSMSPVKGSRFDVPIVDADEASGADGTDGVNGDDGASEAEFDAVKEAD